MPARLASSHADHRRGLVLGLTMAEVLLLLLFVLLLTLASRISTLLAETAQARRELTAIEPYLAALEGGDLDVQSIPRRLAELENFQRQLAEARQETTALRARLAVAESELAAVTNVIDAARKVNPSAAPAATLRQALDKLTPEDEPIIDAQERSAMLARLEEAAQRIDPSSPPVAVLESAIEQFSKGEGLKGVAVAVLDKERQLAQALGEEFGKDLIRWNAHLDKKSLILRFDNPELLFEAGSAALNRKFEGVLSDFFPRYLARLAQFRDDIEEVRIEGHTSSEWRGATDAMENYFNNMALSQDRTRAVLEYGMVRTAISSDTRMWARGLITANGMASSRLWRRRDGSEDPGKSRRVEFRVLMKLRERIMGAVSEG